MRQLDVIVLGGGGAGLSLALQLLRSRPTIRVAVLDSRALPGDPERVRLGESVSEAAGWYLGERLGLHDHLVQQHVLKHGLRFFFGGGRGQELGSRPEFAAMRPGGGFWELPFEGTHPPTYQLHRGRLEAEMARRVAALGGELIGGVEVDDIQLGPPHRVGELEAPWLIDASGRAGLLEEELQGRHELGHQVLATWTWTSERVDPDQLSASPAFRSRTPADLRWRSTSHLMGPGYWLWLIPVPGGGTSIGLVRDPQLGSLPDAASLRTWCEHNEPELAPLLEEGPVFERLAVASRIGRLLSDRGLAATGDAAVFMDPLYSSAFDLIAVANELITATVVAPPFEQPRACRLGSTLYERVVEQYMPMYRGMYGLMGHPRVISAKTAWDNAMYFGFVAPWVRSGELADPLGFTRLRWLAERFGALQQRMQALFRDWAEAEAPERVVDQHFDQSQARFLLAVLDRLKQERGGIELRRQLQDNLADLERLALCIFQRAARGAGQELELEQGLDPYAIRLPVDLEALRASRELVRVRASWREDCRRAWLDAP